MAKADVTARVREMLTDYLRTKNLDIYKIEYRKEGPDWKLRVFLDKPAESGEEYVSIEECEDVTHYLSDRLDQADLIDRKYMLEVSSPGLDRELIRASDFERFAGRMVEVRLYEPMDGRKHFEAILVGRADDGIITLNDEGSNLEIPEQRIARINLAVIF